MERDQLVERTGLDLAQVNIALIALNGEEPAFIKVIEARTLADYEILAVTGVTGHARRTVNTWPTAEGLARSIIDGLIAAAEAEPDEAKKGKLKRAAEILDNAGWGVLLGVVGNIASKGLGV